MHDKSNLFAVGGLIGVTLVSGAVLVAPRASADNEVTATATITVSSTCSMTGTAVANTNSAGTSDGGAHTATVLNGSYTSEIGKTQLNTLCNDAAGYSIYAVGYTGNTKGSNVLHSSVNGSTYDIVTGTATSAGSPDVSNWAMKVFTEGNSSTNPEILNGYSSYSAVPSQYAKVAQYASTTGVAGSSLYTTYAAYISGTQPAGTYQGQVKYVLVHPSTSAPTATDAGYNMQNVATWKDNLATGEAVRAVDTRDGQAYWVQKLDDGNIWMTQNLNIDLGGTYNDAPIVFTSENTDLNISTANADGTGATLAGYTCSNASTTSGCTDPGEVITWTPAAAAQTAATISNFASGNPASVSGWSDTGTAPRQAEGKLTYTPDGSETPVTVEMIMRKGTSYKGLSDCMTRGGFSEAECSHYYVGNYYNFTAAVALNNSGSGVSSNFVTDKYVMPNSICPKGWRLPNGLTAEIVDETATTIQSDFNKLASAYGLAGGTDLSGGTNVTWAGGGYSAFESAPLYFARSGLVYGSTLNGYTGRGYYWSSTVNSSDNGYTLVYNTSVLYPANRNTRYSGGSVRCVAR